MMRNTPIRAAQCRIPKTPHAIHANSRGTTMNRTKNTGMKMITRILPRWGALIALFTITMLAGPAVAQNSVPRAPTITNGYGTLSVSTSSVAVSTVTTSPNSGAWVMPLNGNLVIQNNGGSNVYVCLLGGTCTASNGWKVPPNAVITFNIGGYTTSPTIISDSSATVNVGW